MYLIAERRVVRTGNLLVVSWPGWNPEDKKQDEYSASESIRTVWTTPISPMQWPNCIEYIDMNSTQSELQVTEAVAEISNILHNVHLARATK